MVYRPKMDGEGRANRCKVCGYCIRGAGHELGRHHIMAVGSPDYRRKPKGAQ